MILYLDTSALVKLFADEPGAERVRGAVAVAEFRGCHISGYAEGCAALARRARELGLTERDLDQHVARFADVWQGLDVIEVHWPLVQRAGRLAVEHHLRGFDSVHLAAAEAVRARVDGAAEFRFAAFDTRLVAAARALGLEVLAP